MPYLNYQFRPEDWGDLAPRYSVDSSRRMLSLDGGGMRGVISLQVLKRIEEIVQEEWGNDTRLCDFFDYISGTSTGAIIAAGLAQGRTVAEISKFYDNFASQVFHRNWWEFNWFGWYSHFKATGLERALQDYVSYGAEQVPEKVDLSPDNLKSLLLIPMRNATTDSLWPIMSCPAAKFNNPRDRLCNLRILLWQLLRASSAAPIIFPPKVLRFNPYDAETEYVFVDGGTTAHNNPSMLLFRTATIPEYNLRWATGESRLLLVSVGTGRPLARSQSSKRPSLGMVSNAKSVINALSNQTVVEQDTNCRTIGRCTFGDVLDDEIGDMVELNIPLSEDLGRKFLYCRYDAELSKKGMVSLGLNDIPLDRVSELDCVGEMGNLKKIGDRIASQVKTEHFGSFIRKNNELERKEILKD